MDQPAQNTPADSSLASRLPMGVRLAAAWSWRLIIIGVAAAAAIFLITQLTVVVIPVAIALLLTVLLKPVERFAHTKLRMRPGMAAAATVVLFLLVVIGLLALAGRTIVKGLMNLSDQFVRSLDALVAWLTDGPLNLTSSQIADYLADISSALQSRQDVLVEGALGVASSVGQFAVGTLIALFCLVFFLFDGRTIWSWLVRLLPRSAREPVHQAGRRGLVTLAAYAKTQVAIAAVDALGIGIGAAFFVPDLALPIGILVFIGSFIPIVGAITTGFVACMVVLVSNGVGAAIIMLVVVLAVQQIEGNVLQPFLMGHAVSLHPVATLLAVTAGSYLAGIVGALLAVPITAVINTVVLYFSGTDKFPELGTEDKYDGAPPGGKEPRAIAAALADFPDSDTEPRRSQTQD